MKHMALSEWFKVVTGREFPLPLRDEDFFQVESQGQRQSIFCTQVLDREDLVGPPHYFAIKPDKAAKAAKAAKEDEADKATNADSTLAGAVDYRLFTFWGYGCNSYAMYQTRITEKGKMYLRLPFGGVYMDQVTSQNNLIEKLVFYEQLFEELSLKQTRFVIHDNMGSLKVSES